MRESPAAPRPHRTVRIVAGAGWPPAPAATVAADAAGHRHRAGRARGWSEHVDGVEPPLHFELIAGGHSNLTFKATDAAGRRLVVRRPPLGHVLATAHDMGREHRIVSAVGPTAVPVAPTFGLCEDDEVNGAPFYVMEFVDGVVLDHPRQGRAAGHADAGGHRRAPHRRARRPARGRRRRGRPRRSRPPRRLHRAPAQAVDQAVGGVQDAGAAGHRGGRSGGSRARVPEQQGTAIVHGDYRLGNCLVDPTTGRINAVLDWELCTLGDPLADVGYLCDLLDRPGPGGSRRANDPTSAGGFPSMDEHARAVLRAHRARRAAASTTTSPSRRGGWPSSARASTPATSTA